MSDASTLRAKIDAAIAAIEIGDWSTAKTNLLAAQAALIAIPDGRQGPDEVRWRSEIEDLLTRVNQELAASSGIQRSCVVYTNG